MEGTQETPNTHVSNELVAVSCWKTQHSLSSPVGAAKKARSILFT
jgi:hypothetical protein